MIYSPTVYVITEGNDQNKSHGQLRLRLCTLLHRERAFIELKASKQTLYNGVGYTLVKDTSRWFVDSLYCAKRQWEINGTDLSKPVYL